MNYWTYVPFNQEELEELLEVLDDASASAELYFRVEGHLNSVREKLAALESAQEAPAVPQVDWDRELGELLGDG